jgi:tyrosinase
VNVELQIMQRSPVRDSCRGSFSMPDPRTLSGVTSPTVNVRITGRSVAGGGAVIPRSTTGSFSSSLTVPVPVTGTTVPFFVAGRFGQPSVNNGDVTIEARTGIALTLVGSVRVMVRIRKNAEALTPGERDRFVAAFAQLNNQGLGRFADFRNMHTDVSSPQAHGARFSAWHRAYLLDLNAASSYRSSVAPYWR